MADSPVNLDIEGHCYPQNSPSRARTYNLAVNSRSLYQLSYRGIPINQDESIIYILKIRFRPNRFNVLSKF